MTPEHARHQDWEEPGPSHRQAERNRTQIQFFVPEEHTGSEPVYIGNLHSEVDSVNRSVKHTLSGIGVGTIFTIDKDKGDIHLLKKLDREKIPFYSLRAQVVDKLTKQHVEPEIEICIQVQDINDNEPKFVDGPYIVTIPEMSPVGTSVTQVTAIDADDADTGNHARVLYQLLQGQPYFSVEPTTGIIRAALSDMDRETKAQHLVLIEGRDMAGLKGGLSATTTVTINLSDVNDNGPKFQHKLYHLAVLESAGVDSTVGRVKATDADMGENAEMSFAIEKDDGSDAFDIFTDDKTQEGVIILKQPLDYETKRRISIRVKVSNTHLDPRFLHLGTFKDVTNVKINVDDVDEPPCFTSPEYNLKVEEERAAGTIVGVVAARDPDIANSAVRYSIDWSTDEDRNFNIDANNGTLTTSKRLDREAVPWYNLSVSASEANDPTKVTKVSVRIQVVDVNDHVPEFPIPYKAFVCENGKREQLIHTISAVDKDEPPNGHHFHFALAPEAISKANFTVRDNRDNTAVILTRRAWFSRREQAVHLVPVIIVDDGSPSLTSTNTLTVRVCACNSNQLCNVNPFALPAGLTTGPLIAILVCLLMVIVLVLLLLTLRRHKKEPLFVSEDHGVKENTVRYDDEGGGEEDTQAFDMVALRNPKVIREAKTRRASVTDLPTMYRRSLRCGPDDTIFREFIRDRLSEADTDPCAPPFDCLQTYVFEGEGSVAGSLSSLASSTADPHYGYLGDWGPHFKKLADLYGSHRDAASL
ncbi:cadherin-7-like [Callorhinchus milii]|uniref:cadherin-7-like n=1 Tax=Callorhinchus milii TaxID=7868 RepID=UPI001C3F5D5C|nr:cadherin-7-like [Callorhinchus milii]